MTSDSTPTPKRQPPPRHTHRIDPESEGVRAELLDGLELNETVEAEGGTVNRCDLGRECDDTHVTWRSMHSFGNFTDRLRRLLYDRGKPGASRKPMVIWLDWDDSPSHPHGSKMLGPIDRDFLKEAWRIEDKLKKVGVTIVPQEQNSHWAMREARALWGAGGREKQMPRLVDKTSRPHMAPKERGL